MVDLVDFVLHGQPFLFDSGWVGFPIDLPHCDFMISRLSGSVLSIGTKCRATSGNIQTMNAIAFGFDQKDGVFESHAGVNR